jgi:D-alanyl-lipoteichoic acid acyltransferase DltB (MBOAT superfamily)
VAWGALHGLAIVVHRFWNRMGLRLPTMLAWLTTFLFVNATWVYFRAPSLADAHRVLKAMVQSRCRGFQSPDGSHGNEYGTIRVGSRNHPTSLSAF